MNVVYAGLLGFVVAFGLGPIVIPVLHRLKFGQMVRDVGPQSHLKKQGTPTMGGLLFLLPLPLAVLLFADNNLEAWALVTLIWSYGMIGLADDLLKVVFKRPLGLKAREKLLFQILFAVAFTWLAARRFHADGPYVLPFHWGTVALPWIFGPLSVLAILGSGNAVNLTDGLDGLAAGAVTLTMAFFAFWGGSSSSNGSSSGLNRSYWFSYWLFTLQYPSGPGIHGGHGIVSSGCGIGWSRYCIAHNPDFADHWLIICP